MYIAGIGAVAYLRWTAYGTFDDVTLRSLVGWGADTFVRVTGALAMYARDDTLPYCVARPGTRFKSWDGALLVKPTIVTCAVLQAAVKCA